MSEARVSHLNIASAKWLGRPHPAFAVPIEPDVLTPEADRTTQRTKQILLAVVPVAPRALINAPLVPVIFPGHGNIASA